jgi:hypothetical protein
MRGGNRTPSVLSGWPQTSWLSQASGVREWHYFGCGDGLVSLFLHTRKKYCHNGGMAFVHHPALACQGSKMAMMAPFRGPLKTTGLQGENP